MNYGVQQRLPRRALICLVIGIAAVVFLRNNAIHAEGSPQPSIKQQLVGSWKLISRQSRLDNGQLVADPGLGDRPSGILIYDSSGHMAAQLSREGRTIEMLKEECAEITKVKTAPNTANTILGYDAYFGTYSVNEKEKVVTHHVESALWPGNQGKSINRSFDLKGDELTITVKTTNEQDQPVTRTLVWQRLK